GVGHARPRRDDHDAGLAGGSGIALGGVHGALLMPHQHVAYARLGIQRIVQGQHGAPRIAKNRIHPACDQGFKQGLRTIACDGFGSSIHVLALYCIRYESLKFITFSSRATKTSMNDSATPWHIVKQSTLHGNGVFAARDIPAGTQIIEYRGKRITPEEADEMHPVNPDDPFHTFLFSLSSGKIIDGGQRGNDARWINHACAPNCETQENASGKKV